MAVAEHLERLKHGTPGWNRWRDEHPSVIPDFSAAHLQHVRLGGANLADANFESAYLGQADLSGANLTGATLAQAYLRGARLPGVLLEGATLTEAELSAVPVRLFLFALVGWAVGTLAGSSLAAGLVRRGGLIHALIVAIALMVRTALRTPILLYPSWVWVLGFLAFPLSGYLGSRTRIALGFLPVWAVFSVACLYLRVDEDLNRGLLPLLTSLETTSTAIGAR